MSFLLKGCLVASEDSPPPPLPFLFSLFIDKLCGVRVGGRGWEKITISTVRSLSLSANPSIWVVLKEKEEAPAVNRPQLMLRLQLFLVYFPHSFSFLQVSVSELMKNLKSKNPNYIRCIKVNSVMSRDANCSGAAHSVDTYIHHFYLPSDLKSSLNI